MSDLVQRIRSLPKNIEDYSDILDEILAQNEILNKSDFFECAFELFENFPKSDFGMPGTLVHKIETFYPEYIPYLINSVKKKPIHYTLWMINRILNDNKIENKLRKELTESLRLITKNKNIDEEIRNEAIKFWELQKNKI